MYAPDDPEPGAGDLWVTSEVMADGSYGVSLNYGPDTSCSLNREQAWAYAAMCHARATEAEHDAAVFALLINRLGMPQAAAARIIVKDIRPDRPEDHTATEPLHFTVALNMQLEPFIQMHLNGEQVGEMTTADLRAHGAGVLNALAAADLDAALFRMLTSKAGLGEDRARQVIHSLAEHWPAEEAPRAGRGTVSAIPQTVGDRAEHQGAAAQD